MLTPFLLFVFLFYYYYFIFIISLPLQQKPPPPHCALSLALLVPSPRNLSDPVGRLLAPPFSGLQCMGSSIISRPPVLSCCCCSSCYLRLFCGPPARFLRDPGYPSSSQCMNYLYRRSRERLPEQGLLPTYIVRAYMRLAAGIVVA